jgi:hypothetical protein
VQKIHFLLIIAFFIVLLPSQVFAKKAEYKIEQMMASWLDIPLEQVVATWGMPDEEKTILNRKVYTWHHDKFTSVGIFTKSHKWFCDRILTVDEKGLVYRADSYGNNCPFGAAGAQYHDWANWENYKKKDPDLNRVKHRSATTL